MKRELADYLLRLFAVWHDKEPCICPMLDWKRREHGNQHAPDCLQIRTQYLQENEPISSEVPELGTPLEGLEVEQLKAYESCLRHLANMAAMQAQAVKLRLAGKIQEATAQERQIDKMYSMLPKEWKW